MGLSQATFFLHNQPLCPFAHLPICPSARHRPWVLNVCTAAGRAVLLMWLDISRSASRLRDGSTASPKHCNTHGSLDVERCLYPDCPCAERRERAGANPSLMALRCHYGLPKRSMCSCPAFERSPACRVNRDFAVKSLS